MILYPDYRLLAYPASWSSFGPYYNLTSSHFSLSLTRYSLFSLSSRYVGSAAATKKAHAARLQIVLISLKEKREKKRKQTDEGLFPSLDGFFFTPFRPRLHTPTPHTLFSILYLTSILCILDLQSCLFFYTSLYTTLLIAAARLPLLPLSLPEANIPDYGFLASTPPPYWSTGYWRIGLSQLPLVVLLFIGIILVFLNLPTNPPTGLS